jgi:hypothetical protein
MVGVRASILADEEDALDEAVPSESVCKVDRQPHELIVLVIRRQLRVTRQRHVDDDRRLIRQKPLSDTKQATRSESIHCGILVLRSSMRQKMCVTRKLRIPGSGYVLVEIVVPPPP